MTVETGFKIYEHPTSIAVYSPINEPHPLTSINEVVETLLMLESDVSIPLGGYTLGKNDKAKLIQKLQVSDISEKLESASRTDPVSPLEQLMAGRLHLITNGMLSGKEAKQQAGRLLTILSKLSAEQGKGEIEITEPKDILTHKQLSEAKDRVESAWVNSMVISQLNPLTIATTGMVSEVSRLKTQSDDKTLVLPQRLVGVLRSLKHEESAIVLQEWILNEMLSPRREECILFLKAAVQISGLIDSNDLIEICGGEFNLLPFESLHAGIGEAVRILEINNGMDEAKDLREVSQQLYLKYRQIALSEKGVQVASQSTELYEEIAISLVLEADKLKLSNGQTAKYIVKVLEQIGTKDFKHFKDGLDYADSQVATLVEREAVRRGLIENGDLQKQIIHETFDELKKRPWRDIADINFKTATKYGTDEKLINPETKVVKFTVVTGTFGPFTEGHRSMIKRLIAYLKYQQESDPPEVQRFILISPLTTAVGVSDYNKTIEEGGTVYERVASMFLGLSDLTDEEKDMIMMTTALSPKPGKAKAIDNSIRTLINEVRNKLRKDFGGIDTMVVTHDIAVGSDEVFKDGTIPTKVKPGINDVVLVVRHGHLIRVIESEVILQRETGVNTVILTPDSANISSSNWRDAILSRNYYGIPVGTRDFIAFHWSKRIREERKARHIKDSFPERFGKSIPPIGYFYHELLKEYPKVANLNGTTT